jgi:hypothetical protein
MVNFYMLFLSVIVKIFPVTVILSSCTFWVCLNSLKFSTEVKFKMRLK